MSYPYRLIELSLELIGAVPKGDRFEPTPIPELGVILSPEASYAEDEVREFYSSQKLTGEQLNATFHKSWKVIKESSREELLIHQILHYFTTYGTDFTSEFVYFPSEVLEIPSLEKGKLPLKVIRALTPTQIGEEAVAMLESGIALKEETVDKIMELLKLVGYRFKTVDNIRNKEALVKIIAEFGVYPSQSVEFLRYLVFLSTGSTLLIKNKGTIHRIKEANLVVTNHLQTFGLKKCAEAFNRFKPLWLAFKGNKVNAPLINKIGKLAKVYHKPMVVNPLNLVTSTLLSDKDSKWLENATAPALVRAFNVCREYMLVSKGDSMAYRIRNGKSFAKTMDTKPSEKILKGNLKILLKEISSRLRGNIEGKEFYIPKSVEIPVPTSEKNFIGNIPTGTKVTHKSLVAGVYWENAWGANDLDLSSRSLNVHVGWNAAYKSEGGSLMYSGDMTNAPNGAAEYLYTNGKGISHSYLVSLNVFRGKNNSKYRMVLGKGKNISKNYMFNPNELLFQTEMETISKESIIGLITPNKGKVSFIFTNMGNGDDNVSRGKHSEAFRTALLRKFENPLTLKEVIKACGGILAKKPSEDTIDLSLDKLDKNSLLKIFV